MSLPGDATGENFGREGDWPADCPDRVDRVTDWDIRAWATGLEELTAYAFGGSGVVKGRATPPEKYPWITELPPGSDPTPGNSRRPAGAGSLAAAIFGTGLGCETLDCAG